MARVLVVSDDGVTVVELFSWAYWMVARCQCGEEVAHVLASRGPEDAIVAAAEHLDRRH